MEPGDVEAVADALRSGYLTGGPAVRRFEEGLAESCGVPHAVAVCNGTAALHLALIALEIQPGAEVITSPLTFVASANAALYVGARPRFSDVGDDRCIDPALMTGAVSGHTAAVVSVDYAGLPADTPAIRKASGNVPVVADAAHSLGGFLGKRPVGSLADITTASFHPVKQITTGEGGACLTADAALAEEIRSRRNHAMTSSASEREGGRWRYDVMTLGYNYRLTDIQAALGSAQLARLPRVVARREELAQRYDHELGTIPGIILPPRPPGRRSAWHLYVIELESDVFGISRDQLIDALRMENIQATLHYPAVPTLSLYRKLQYRVSDTPRAQALAERIVTLPLFPSMSESDQDDVVAALRRLAAWHGGH